MKKINNDFSNKSDKYENSLDKKYKKNHGIFYTDLELANRMVKFLNPPKDSAIIDPCCGTGSFIYALQQNGYKNIVGCDFDKNTVNECIELTGCKKIHKMDTIGKTGKQILKKIESEPFDYIIGNPPYAPINDKNKIKSTDEFIKLVDKSGKNLFVGAIYRAFELVKSDGYISLIVPKNLLHISSYKKIRENILKEKTIVSIVELGIHFKAVRGEQIILTLKNDYNPDNIIKFYSHKNGKMVFLSEVPQSYYKDKIIVFTSNDEIKVFDKLKTKYNILENICSEPIHRGHNNTNDAIRGKQIRKFGFKDNPIPIDGNQIFMQNIFSAEAGMTASFGGNLKPAETVTILKFEDYETSKYILGLLNSRLCNYYLIKFGFNNSRLTIHTDAQYLNNIPIVIDKNENFYKMLDIVNKMETVEYMENEWFELNEKLNELTYEIYEISKEDTIHIEGEMKNISASKWYGSKVD